MTIFKKIMLLILIAGSAGSVTFGTNQITREQLKKALDQVVAVEEFKKVMQDPALERCCICQDDIYPAHAITITPCGHIFHTGCLNESLCHGTTCPLCRADLTAIITLAQQTAQRIHEAERIIERIRLDHEAAMRMATEEHPDPELAADLAERAEAFDRQLAAARMLLAAIREHELTGGFAAEFITDENGYILTNHSYHDRS